MQTTETLYHVTLLSNFVRAYDKYSRVYTKSKLPKSTYPNQFFLLRESEIHIGLRKSEELLGRIGEPGDCCIALQTIVQSSALHANPRTGLGRFVQGGQIVVAGVAWLCEGHRKPVPVEEAIAEGLRSSHSTMFPYDALRPRSFSVLPIARGCQAACSFCFSKSSNTVSPFATPPELVSCA